MIHSFVKNLPISLGVICLVVMHTSCNKIYQFCNQPIPLQCTDLDYGIKKSCETGSFCVGDQICERWWPMFNDSQLTSLVDRALGCNPTIEIAISRIRLANQEACLTHSALLPSITAMFDIFRHKTSQFASIPPPELGIFTETAIRAVNVSYELDLWMKNRKAYYAALDETQATVADAKETELVISTSLSQHYFMLQTALEQVAITKELLDTQNQLYTLLEQRFKNGIISEFNLYEVDSERMITLDLLEQYQNDVDIGLHAIASLVGGGINPECLCQPNASFNRLFPLPRTLPLDLIARRPDITAQKWRIEEMAYKIGVAQAAFYPSVNLLAFAGFTSILLHELFTDRASNIYGDVAIHLPIFEGGKLKANLGIAKERFEIAVGEYNERILSAVREVSDFLTMIITADRRLEAIDRGLKDAQAIYQLTYEKYKNGVDDYLSVLNAKQTVLLTKDLKVSIEGARLLAVVGLIRSIGGGYDERC